MNKKEEKVFLNLNTQTGILQTEDKDTEEVMYCMIAPTADDVLDNKDDGTVCSNRS